MNLAVSKLWKVENRLDKVINYAVNKDKTNKALYSQKDVQALKDVLSYVKNEEKTEKEYYVSGINCEPDKARSQFIRIKRQFDALDGIQAYHGYMSFEQNETTPEIAHQIGIEFAERVWGKRFQVVVTTHLNTKNLHNHFVVNSVSFVDGKRLQNEEKAWFINRHVVDEICKSYGLSVIEKPERNRDNYYLTMKDKAGMPTRYNYVKEAIDYAISHSYTMKEFQINLTQMGYRYQFSNNRKYWTVIPQGWNKPIRLYRLGEDYTNLRIQERIEENEKSVRISDFQYRKSYEVPKKFDIRRQKGSLYNLYLYYCYKLGYLPNKNKPKKVYRLHPTLREDMMKLDKIVLEVRLLSDHQIDNAQELFLYKTSLVDEYQHLLANRTDLRKVLRQKVSNEKLDEAKGEILLINDKLKKIRKEITLCDDIAERSDVIKNNIEQIEYDENEQIRRNKNHEQCW